MQSTKAIRELVKVQLTNSQLQALESFVADRGLAIFRNSTLLKVINKNDTAAIITEFRKWTLDAGKPSQRLVELREQEIVLFTK
jgi:lysozyme